MSQRTALKAAPVALRDGSRVLVRAVDPSDKELIRAGFDRLGAESRYRRFLTPTSQLTASMLRYLTEVDHHDHEALVALGPDSGEGAGIARFIRTSDPRKAEVAVTVVDNWQGRGVGTVLLELLAERAREEGVRTFSAYMLAANREMIDLLRRLGSMHVVERERSVIEAEAELPPKGLHPGLVELLRQSADPASSLGPAKTLLPDQPAKA